MTTRIRTRLYRGALASVAGAASEGATRRAAEITARRTRDNISALQRVDTGAMRRGIVARRSPTSTPLRPRWQVRGTEKHTVFQEFGTRAHGPVRAQFLRFKPKGSNTFVFAKWVRGVTPGRFMRKALDRLRVEDYT